MGVDGSVVKLLTVGTRVWIPSIHTNAEWVWQPAVIPAFGDTNKRAPSPSLKAG